MKGNKFIKLSVLVPGIRPQNWEELYDSIANACTQHSFEVIFIGPYDLPLSLGLKDNVRYIKSFRSPIAAQQEGLCVSNGEYIAWCADDGVCLPGSFDDALKLVEGKECNHIIIGKYIEGGYSEGMLKGFYYCLRYHESMRLPGVPANAWLLNCGIVSRTLLIGLGGWDADTFQVCPMAYNDFSIRALKAGATFELMEDPMFQCDWLPGMEGDHGPIHIAQTEYDEPAFKRLYAQQTDRQAIYLFSWNWDSVPKVWSLRFKDK